MQCVLCVFPKTVNGPIIDQCRETLRATGVDDAEWLGMIRSPSPWKATAALRWHLQFELSPYGSRAHQLVG